MGLKDTLILLSVIFAPVVFIFGGIALAIALGVTGAALTSIAVFLGSVGFFGFIAYLGWMTFASA